MSLTKTALIDVVAEVNLMNQPVTLVLTLAEKSITEVAKFAEVNNPEANIDNLRKLLTKKIN